MNTASADAVRAACYQLDHELESIPGIQAVSLTWAAFPLSGEDDEQFWFEDQPKPQSESEMNWALSYVVEPGYLKAMGIRPRSAAASSRNWTTSTHRLSSLSTTC